MQHFETRGRQLIAQFVLVRWEKTLTIERLFFCRIHGVIFVGQMPRVFRGKKRGEWEGKTSAGAAQYIPHK